MPFPACESLVYKDFIARVTAVTGVTLNKSKTRILQDGKWHDIVYFVRKMTDGRELRWHVPVPEGSELIYPSVVRSCCSALEIEEKTLGFEWADGAHPDSLPPSPKPMLN